MAQNRRGFACFSWRPNRRLGPNRGPTTPSRKGFSTRRVLINKAPTCTPGAEHLAQDGAYPSGHTTIGWTWALILTEIAPDRSQILARHRSFGQSRDVCNVHWQGDVIEGGFLAAANGCRADFPCRSGGRLERGRSPARQDCEASARLQGRSGGARPRSAIRPLAKDRAASEPDVAAGVDAARAISYLISKLNNKSAT
jgi:membrane-associated phospholipid phosphatase